MHLIQQYPSRPPPLATTNNNETIIPPDIPYLRPQQHSYHYLMCTNKTTLSHPLEQLC
jgi:hypothetical protein